MAYGGGTFTAQNKILAGSYINVKGATRTSSILGDRGIVAYAMNLDWGEDGFTILNVEDFQKDAMKLFGYHADSQELVQIRDIFKNANKLYLYRLNQGGEKATNTYATAKFAGTRGNAIAIKMEANPDGGFDVTTLVGTATVDKQTVATSADLKENDYVTFKSFSTPSLTSAITALLAGGTNGTVSDEAVAHTTFLGLVDKYPVNVVCYGGTTANVAALYIAFAKRVREELGLKLQVVTYNVATTAPDYEGVVYVYKPNNYNVTGGYICWVAGAVAGCPINRSLTNKIYDGEAELKVQDSQAELENAIRTGLFAFHQVGEDFRVLDDINSLTTFTTEKGEYFKDNQTIRVLDQIATDIATLFNTKYLGIIPNDNAGRIALWNDIVTHHRSLETMRAIENFDPNLVVVNKGESKKSVVVSDVITVTNAMAQLYMTVEVQ